MLISRSDNSNIALWWWTIDRFLLTLFSILIIVGIFLVMASSQHLAQSFNIFSHYFTLRHILFVIISLPIIFLFSLLNEKQTKAISIIGLIFMEVKLKAQKDGYIFLDLAFNLVNYASHFMLL
jgi:cell division protein FtsW